MNVIQRKIPSVNKHSIYTVISTLEILLCLENPNLYVWSDINGKAHFSVADIQGRVK